MENQSRTHTINHQDENVNGNKNKSKVFQRDIFKKDTIPDAECEKKPLNAFSRRTCCHVQAKVDTGLGSKSIQASSRPPLHTTRAAMLTRNAVKEAPKEKTLKLNQLRRIKDLYTSLIGSRDQINLKLSPIQEISEEGQIHIIKDTMDSLGKKDLMETILVLVINLAQKIHL
ncbi:unnamed protein product [Leptosia nina]|uniref:Uncharacterized protein n=1 Tax=Leptosia nina TaxID=320188 RepID=A0AAV1IY41_9NEOP